MKSCKSLIPIRSMRRRVWALAVAVCLVPATSVAAPAQTLVPKPPVGQLSTPPGATLKDALAQVKGGTDQPVMVLGADEIPLPPGGKPLSGAETLPEIAEAYKLKLFKAGPLSALATPEMVVLNTSPVIPDPYASVQPDQAFKLFVASLSDTQWQALTGESGIGLGDLPDDLQIRLFWDIFPGHALTVRGATGLTMGADATRDLSGDLATGRLRLVMKGHIHLPVLGHPGYSLNGLPGIDRSGSAQYQAVHRPNPLSSTEGIKPAETVSNQLKESDLDYDDPALKAKIPLNGVSTVAAMIQRVGKITHLEMYSDKRLDSKSITFVGAAPSAPASALLKALAYCLTATYRRVGPAYVLTDDRVGFGTRQIRLSDLFRRAQALRDRGLDQAGILIARRHSPSELKATGDPLALTSDQLTRVRLDDAYHGQGATVSLPFDQLTAAQQDATKLLRDDYLADPGNSTYGDRFLPGDPDLKGPILITSEPAVEFVTPSLDRPVNLSNILPSIPLFRVPSALLEEPRNGGPEPSAGVAAGATKPMLLADALRGLRERAVFAAPRSPDEVDALIGYMHRNGFTSLWLPVALPSKADKEAVPSEGPASAPQGTDLDVLDHALAACKGTNIRLLAVIRLMRSGAPVSSDLLDRTILGDASPEPEQRKRQAMKNADLPDSFIAAVPDGKNPVVSPFGKGFSDGLLRTMKELARRDGLSGVVWSDLWPEGYQGLERGNQTTSTAFGYGETARLAFLRAYHEDPVDLSTISVPFTRLPNFPWDPRSEAKTFRQWTQFLLDQQVAVMRDAVRDLTVSPGAKPGHHTGPKSHQSLEKPTVFVASLEDSTVPSCFTTWDDLNGPLPMSSGPRTSLIASGPPASPTAVAGFQPRNVVLRIIPTDMSGSALALDIKHRLEGTACTGLVLDLTESTLSQRQMVDHWKNDR